MTNCYRFLARGNELERSEALEYPVLVAGDIVAEENTVAAFESDAEFLEWTKDTKHAERVTEIHRQTSDLTDVAANYKRNEERLKRVACDTIRNLEALSAKTSLPTWSEELFIRAIEEKVLRSSLIYRHINLGGDFRPIVTGAPVPFFSWIGFNDVASSALVSGSLLLCARTLFRGKRLWLFGAPAVRWNLTDFGFNDRASSGAAFG